MALINRTYQRADAFLFGRRTYELFAGYWGAEERARAALKDPGSHPIAAALNAKPKYLASTTLGDPQWPDTTLLSGDLAAAIGALYAALTVALAPISYGALQFRVSEALCILPFFFPYSMWGLFVGCILANVLGGCGPLDIIFGSLATLLAGYLTSKIRLRPLAPLPAVLVNTAVVGAVIAFTATPENFWAGFAVIAPQVGFGELVVLYVLGLPLLYLLPKNRHFSAIIEKLGGRGNKKSE
jgi:uncharacterized membrane protein